jgi:hypothetical protein
MKRELEEDWVAIDGAEVIDWALAEFVLAAVLAAAITLALYVWLDR